MGQTLQFDADHALHALKHYLPTQAPLKDFIHHNTLHAFQEKRFDEALTEANEIFGFKVYLTLSEYRKLYREGRISDEILERVIRDKASDDPGKIRELLINAHPDETIEPRIGQLRSNWKSFYRIDLDSLVHPTLFRIIGSYLDQGISIWNFPALEQGFLRSIAELERNSIVSFFKTDRVRGLLLNHQYDLEALLRIVVGDPALYEQYLFDQQFAHPGWSGMVAVLDENPDALVDKKKITLEELIVFELLLEIDALDDYFGNVWAPLGLRLENVPVNLFAEVHTSEQLRFKQIWHEAYEWSYYDEVLSGVRAITPEPSEKTDSFQALFCIDDRECSIRRYIEQEDPESRTYGTAGFFGVEFYFQPEGGKLYTKVCPAPVTPKYLIKEIESTDKRKKDFHFGKHSHGLLTGWLLTHTLGFWSVLKLFTSVFKPMQNESSVSSFRHMGENSTLTIENVNGERSEEGLQIGYTVQEMTDRLEALLRSIGLIDNFAPLVYVVGHGSSSVNNTHYAGYDCGACSGRPGSVNARVICHIGNHPEVRKALKERGISIPETTQFVGGLHDTSRDEVKFYDLQVLNESNEQKHRSYHAVFNKALSLNARERSRRFMSINSTAKPEKVHDKVKLRTVSLFEPRPELNHATNALCIVGRREFSKQIFLDRRSFLNSYDPFTDPEGKYLLGILNAVAPVCGGINLEYFFSRMDNQKLGAGTKLPHNVMGLIGVANGIDGDLRTGLPSQMIEVHDPVRLMVIVEHYPDVVLETIKKNPATYEWFANDWVKLCSVHPVSRELYLFSEGEFKAYEPVLPTPQTVNDLSSVIIREHENIPVYLLNQH
jgi:uncharacterized protein YbcC (UPF0753/DUF2309 family)